MNMPAGAGTRMKQNASSQLSFVFFLRRYITELYIDAGSFPSLNKYGTRRKASRKEFERFPSGKQNFREESCML